MGKLDGRVVLVTGAARGQGEQEARLFRAEGAEVANGQDRAVSARPSGGGDAGQPTPAVGRGRQADVTAKDLSEA